MSTCSEPEVCEQDTLFKTLFVNIIQLIFSIKKVNHHDVTAFSLLMEKILIPLNESLRSKESKLSFSSSDEKKLEILPVQLDEDNELRRCNKLQMVKVFVFPFDACRLGSLVNFLKQYSSDMIKLLKLPNNSDFFLAEPVSAQFCFFADPTRVFVELKCFEEVSLTAVEALMVIFNDFSTNCAVESSVSPVANGCWEARKALISGMQERSVVKVACKQFLLLDCDLEESPDAPLVFRDNHCCIPSLEWFLSSQTKNGSHPLGTNTGKGLHEKFFESDTWQNIANYWQWNFFESSRLQQNKILQLMREKANLTEEATKVTVLQRKLAKTQEELQETFLQMGQLSVEHEKMVRERGKEIAQQSYISKTSVGTQAASTQCEPVTTATLSTQGDDACAISRVAEGQPLNISVQETTDETSAGKRISLGYLPSTAVERSIYNKYKLLLLTIEGALLSDDVTKLKEWASDILSVNISLSVSEIFLEMDQKGVISSSNLNLLRYFFEKIIRIDLVYLIDCFLRGEYGHLQQTNGSVKKINASINTRPRATPIRSASDACLTPSPASGYNVNPPSAYAKMSSTVSQTKLQGTLTNSNLPGVQRKTQGFQKVHENVVRNGMVTDGYEGNGNDANNEAENCTSMANNNARKVVLTCSNHPSSPVNHGRGPLFDMGSNGKKLSKFLRPNSAHDRRTSPQDCESDDDDESQWLCNHYKRRCHVKFDCCNKYWPCHRCHNSKSNCGQNKLKSRDTKFIKCVKCGTEQQFNEGSQFCIQCKTKLAKYFCFICKHLTGTDDHPYHCDKCGICRIHGDRSFHCDVCGVCLDVQLRGNHKCRAGSAHDECCICLEDAFTGCQILPCSHKVHKECATKMIRSGITRCPICRESFAHKLERRPQPTKKLTRKK